MKNSFPLDTDKSVNSRVISMRLLATFSFSLITALSTHAQGIIWSASSSAGNSGTPGSDWQIAFEHVSGSATSPGQSPLTSIFVQRLNTNDSGHTFFANALNSSGFTGFVTGFTDGANGYLWFQAGSPSAWGGRPEQQFLGRSPLSPDLAGYTITQIGFRVNNFYDYYDVPEDRYFRQLDYSLDFYGAPVPEPGTWALLGVGSALLWSATRRRRK